MNTASGASTGKNIRPWRDGLAVGLITFFASVVCSSVMYYYASLGLLRNVQETLFHVTRTAAVMTDGDLHRTLTDNSQKNSADYLAVQKPYREILAANPGIRYIYTLVERGDKAYFIIDTQQPEGAQELPETERKTTANIMEEYTDISARAKRALHERAALAEDRVYQDEWGTFLSAYVPVYDSRKQYVGIVGADIDAREFMGRMNAIRIPYFAGLACALLFSACVGLLIAHHRKGHAQRLEARLRQLEAMERFHLDMLAATKDVATISFKMDGKTAQIAGMAQTSTEKTQLATKSIQGSSDKMHAISDAADRLLQVVVQLSITLEQYGAALKDNIAKMCDSTLSANNIQAAMKNITGVVGIINDITERIDLLALNASIEAARAGDAGKGFAVVAGEVKTLAAQARTSTEQIARNVTTMDKVVRQTTEGMIDTNTLHEQIDAITAQAKDVIVEQQGIVAAINEDIRDVTGRAEEIIQTVQQIAQMAAEISTKTMHMHKDVHMLYQHNLSLSNEVEEFIQKI